MVERQFFNRIISRRTLLRAGAYSGLGIAAAAIVGCDGESSKTADNQPSVPTSVRSGEATQAPTVRSNPTEVSTVRPNPTEAPTATVLPRVTATVDNSSVNRALRLDGNGDSVEYDGEKFTFQAPLRIDARIKIADSALNIGGNAIIAKGENDSIAFFASLTSCPERGMALIVDGREPVCGPRVQSRIWKEVSAVFDGKNVIFYQDGVEVVRKQWEGSIAIDSGKLFVGKSPSGFVTQEFFGGDIDSITVTDMRTNKVLFGPSFDSDFKDPISGVSGVPKGDARLVSVN